MASSPAPMEAVVTSCARRASVRSSMPTLDISEPGSGTTGPIPQDRRQTPSTLSSRHPSLAPRVAPPGAKTPRQPRWCRHSSLLWPFATPATSCLRPWLWPRPPLARTSLPSPPWPRTQVTPAPRLARGRPALRNLLRPPRLPAPRSPYSRPPPLQPLREHPSWSHHANPLDNQLPTACWRPPQARREPLAHDP